MATNLIITPDKINSLNMPHLMGGNATVSSSGGTTFDNNTIHINGAKSVDGNGKIIYYLSDYTKNTKYLDPTVEYLMTVDMYMPDIPTNRDLRNNKVQLVDKTGTVLQNIDMAQYDLNQWFTVSMRFKPNQGTTTIAYEINGEAYIGHQTLEAYNPLDMLAGKDLIYNDGEPAHVWGTSFTHRNLIPNPTWNNGGLGWNINMPYLRNSRGQFNDIRNSNFDALTKGDPQMITNWGKAPNYILLQDAYQQSQAVLTKKLTPITATKVWKDQFGYFSAQIKSPENPMAVTMTINMVNGAQSTQVVKQLSQQTFNIKKPGEWNRLRIDYKVPQDGYINIVVTAVDMNGECSFVASQPFLVKRDVTPWVEDNGDDEYRPNIYYPTKETRNLPEWKFNSDNRKGTMRINTMSDKYDITHNVSSPEIIFNPNQPISLGVTIQNLADNRPDNDRYSARLYFWYYLLDENHKKIDQVLMVSTHNNMKPGETRTFNVVTPNVQALNKVDTRKVKYLQLFVRAAYKGAWEVSNIGMYQSTSSVNGTVMFNSQSETTQIAPIDKTLPTAFLPMPSGLVWGKQTPLTSNREYRWQSFVWSQTGKGTVTFKIEDEAGKPRVDPVTINLTDTPQLIKMDFTNRNLSQVWNMKVEFSPEAEIGYMKNMNLFLNLPVDVNGHTEDEFNQQEINDAKFKRLTPDDLVIGRNYFTGAQGVSFSDLGVHVGRVKKNIAPEITNQMQQATGRYGTVYQGTSYGTKTFQIPITMMAYTSQEYNDRLRALSAALIHPHENLETTIIFGDDPDIYYIGHFTSLGELTYGGEQAWAGEATLSFELSDPRGFRYGKPEQVKLEGGKATFVPLGTGYSDPIISIKLGKDSKSYTQFGYKNQEGKGVVAGHVQTATNIFDSRPNVWTTEMKTIDEWAPVPRNIGTTPAENNNNLSFKPARNLILSDAKFRVGDRKENITNRLWEAGPEHLFAQNSWGEPDQLARTKLNQWIGGVYVSKQHFTPALKDGDNWEMSMRVHNSRKYSRANQAIDIYLLDKSGQRRARLGISNNSGKPSFAVVRFGKDDRDEEKALKTGLGTKSVETRKEDIKNYPDVKVPINRYESINGYIADKQVINTVEKQRWANNNKMRETKQTITITNVFNRDKNKMERHEAYSPKTVTEYTNNTRGPNNRYGYVRSWKRTPNKKYNKWQGTSWIVGQPQMWRKGERHHKYDVDTEQLNPGNYQSNNSIKQKWYWLYKHFDITEYNYSTNGKTIKKKRDLTYHDGVLDNMNVSSETTYGSNRELANAVPNGEKSYNDPREYGSLDDGYFLLTVGHDDLGFYYKVSKLDSKGDDTNKPLLPKTYDKRPSLHSGYEFVPDQVAISYTKKMIEEDANRKNTKTDEGKLEYEQTQPYSDHLMSIDMMSLHKLVNPPEGADLISLKSGDEAIFTTADDRLTINGKDKNGLVQLPTYFPQLHGGETTTISTLEKMDNADVTVTYVPTYL